MVNPFDLTVFNFIHQLTGRFVLFDFLGIIFAEYVPYLLAVWIFILVIKEGDWKRRYYAFALTVLSVILSRGLIAELIRHFYFRARPFVVLQFTPLINVSATEPAFPSGHAAAYFALAVAAFYFGKKTGFWFLTITILMAFARIYVGVHWPLDILGGALIGIISALIIKKLIIEPKVS